MGCVRRLWRPAVRTFFSVNQRGGGGSGAYAISNTISCTHQHNNKKAKRTLQSHYSLKRVDYCVRTAPRSIGGIKRFLRYVRVHELNHLRCSLAPSRSVSIIFVQATRARTRSACASCTCGAIMISHRSSVCLHARARSRLLLINAHAYWRARIK